MRTAGEIALRALVRSGVLASSETPTAAELSDAVTTLGDMLDAWSLERLAVVGTSLVALPVRRPLITIGPSGDVVGPRPNAFFSGFVRRQGRDVPVHQASMAYIDGVCNKGHFADGHWLAFEGSMPDATVRIWPVPPDGELMVRFTGPITTITNHADLLELPPGWYQALVLNLAVHICGEYGQAVSADLADLARSAKAAIKRANLQPAVATFDPALLSSGSHMRDGSGFGGSSPPVVPDSKARFGYGSATAGQDSPAALLASMTVFGVHDRSKFGSFTADPPENTWVWTAFEADAASAGVTFTSSGGTGGTGGWQGAGHAGNNFSDDGSSPNTSPLVHEINGVRWAFLRTSFTGTPTTWATT